MKPAGATRGESSSSAFRCILSIDPGRSCGYAFWIDQVLYESGTERDELIVSLVRHTHKEFGPLDLVIVEAPVCSGVHFDHSPYELLGALRQATADLSVAGRRGRPLFHKSNPGSMAGPKRWVAADVWALYRTEHERDAIAHGLAYFRRTKFPSPKDYTP